MMMAIQKILLSVVSEFVVGVWDGLDACKISRPEILSQSAPATGSRNVRLDVSALIPPWVQAATLASGGRLVVHLQQAWWETGDCRQRIMGNVVCENVRIVWRGVPIVRDGVPSSGAHSCWWSDVLNFYLK